jgi:hypothetical protein
LIVTVAVASWVEGGEAVAYEVGEPEGTFGDDDPELELHPYARSARVLTTAKARECVDNARPFVGNS